MPRVRAAGEEAEGQYDGRKRMTFLKSITVKQEIAVNTKTNPNGQTRRSLGEQIDRLDSVIDALSVGLNEAVATAVQEAVREAVQAVLKEVLTNPDLLAVLRTAVGTPAQGPTPAAQPVAVAPKPSRVRSFLGGAWGWVCGLFRQAGRACAAVPRRVVGGLAWVWCRLRLLRPFRIQLVTALAVGVAAGAAVYLAGPYAAAAAGWLGGFMTTLAVQAAVAFRRLMAPTSADGT
jgi:hypothetical protein